MADKNITQLYDENSNFIYPYTSSKGVEGYTNETVWDDLHELYGKVNTLIRDSSGATSIENNLGIIVKYAANNISDATLVLSENFNSEVVILPTARAPYAWSKTVYMWGDLEVKTVYNIIATALYPETQVMYTSLPTVIGGDSSISGPYDYGVEQRDTSNENVSWDNFFRGIDASRPYGYMAIRHREAGQLYPVTDLGKPQWNISLFAQYPIGSNLPSE